jgi:nucleoside diphosphate kinase
MEYSVQDDQFPISTKESWEFLRRYPTFYAYNPNSRTYSRLDSRDKVKTRYNQWTPENVCVIFKDLTLGQVPGCSDDASTTAATDSLSFFLGKAMIREGLEICGMRLIYLDKDQVALYEHLFNEKLTAHEGSSLLALFLRGTDAIAKCEAIVGHFNPEMARKTKEKSVRALFGRDKRNCVLKMFASQKKNLSELIFWFGGRVQQDTGAPQVVPMSTTYLVVPPRVEKQFLFLSPLVTARELPQVLQVLCDFGVSLLDIQKINYERLQYEGEPMNSAFNKNLCLFKLRGSTLLIPVGFVLKLSREALVRCYKGKLSARISRSLKHLQEQSARYITNGATGAAAYMSSSEKEYKVLRQKLRQNIFNMNYTQLQIEHLKPKSAEKTDYDSEDTENYREIALFNNRGPADSPSKKVKPTGGAASVAEPAGDAYETQTFAAFLKVSLIRKQFIREILTKILSQRFELLGLKLVNAKREIYNELVPIQIRTLFKKVAYKFYEGAGLPDLRLRKKISEFKTIVLILRGRNIEESLSKIYDKEKLKFLHPAGEDSVGIFEGLPQGIFLTNKPVVEPFLDFLLQTRMIKLFHDFALPHPHLLDSPVFSYLLHHNLDRLDPVTAAALADSDLAQNTYSVANIVQIRTAEQLNDTQQADNNKLSACVVVVKPN